MIEMILNAVLIRVVSDHGNFLLRKSLMNAFPNPRIKEYIVEIIIVIRKLWKFFSFVKNKKKKSAVPSDTQNKMINPLRFMSCFSGSKLVFNKGIKNYYLLKGRFFVLNGRKKTFRIRKVYCCSYFACMLRKYSASVLPQFGSNAVFGL